MPEEDQLLLWHRIVVIMFFMFLFWVLLNGVWILITDIKASKVWHRRQLHVMPEEKKCYTYKDGYKIGGGLREVLSLANHSKSGSMVQETSSSLD